MTMKTILLSFLTLTLLAGQSAAQSRDDYQLARVTVATTRMPAMVRFYNEVFHARMKETDIGGVVMHIGYVAGVELLLCPNDISKVKADLNRHMLRVRVGDFDDVLKRVRGNGGTVDAAPVMMSGERIVAIRDPDGNTIEIVTNTIPQRPRAPVGN
jgi:catechol 2,3-dioxygenase-like lactoylglutathione lyase family enzyme